MKQQWQSCLENLIISEIVWQLNHECWIPPLWEFIEQSQTEGNWVVLTIPAQNEFMKPKYCTVDKQLYQTAPPPSTRTTTLTVLGSDGFAAGKNGKSRTPRFLQRRVYDKKCVRRTHRVHHLPLFLSAAGIIRRKRKDCIRTVKCQRTGLSKCR